MRLKLDENTESVRCSIDIVTKKQLASWLQKELEERTEKAMKKSQGEIENAS